MKLNIRYLGVIAVILLALLFIGCTEEKKPTPTPTPVKTPPATPKPTPRPTQTPAKKPTAPGQVQAGTVKCELCHTNPDKYTPHMEGGKYCYNCHGSKVHEIHLGKGTINLDCKTCHGVPPKVPKAQEGHVVCEVCHGFPNPLEPSNGNLIKIHLSRGKYCTNCHGLDLKKIHAEGLKKFEQ